MKIIEQSWQWIQKPELPLELIEKAGRTCYKSEDKITEGSAKKFVEMVIKRGHHSVIEHVTASVKFITNRGVLAELTRHRLAAYSVESTRYCNYGRNDIIFIRPVWWFANLPAQVQWILAMEAAEQHYNALLELKWRPEQAREVLPNSLKTEIVMTANAREWRHVFRLRTPKASHPQIRELMLSCLEGFQKEVPIIFDDIGD